MRKLFALCLLVILLLVPLAGCDLPDWNDPPPVSGTTAAGGETQPTGNPPADTEKPYEDSWCYARLSVPLQEGYAALYEAVELAVTAADEKVTVDGRSYVGVRVELPVALRGREEARRLYTAFTTDQPQFFFLSNLYSYEGYRTGDVDFYNTFSLVFNMSRQERRQASVKLEHRVRELLAQLPRGGADYDYSVELFFHEQLLADCTYEDRLNKEEDPVKKYPQAFTAYGALVEGTAGCEGYSRAMQLLLNRAGIACTLVSGFATSPGGERQGHMWNLVKIQGRGYHLDVTWNDSDELPRHTYFNLTTEEILLTHELDGADVNIGVDTCTATDANYYRREGLYLDTYRPEDIAAVLADSIERGLEMVDMRFPPDKLPSAKLLISNADRLASYVEPLLSEGKSAWERYRSYVDETYGTITLREG